MSRDVLRAALVATAFAVSAGLAAEAWAAGKDNPAAVCDNRALPYRQRYLCKQEMEGAGTKTEQKKIAAKFTSMVREAEKAEKEK
jgi:hypothetical protein